MAEEEGEHLRSLEAVVGAVGVQRPRSQAMGEEVGEQSHRSRGVAEGVVERRQRNLVKEELRGYLHRSQEGVVAEEVVVPLRTLVMEAQGEEHLQNLLRQVSSESRSR